MSLSVDWPLPPTQMIRIEANGRNRGSRPDDGAWRGKKSSDVCVLQVESGWTCFPPGKKSLKMFLHAGPIVERPRQRLIREERTSERCQYGLFHL